MWLWGLLSRVQCVGSESRVVPRADHRRAGQSLHHVGDVRAVLRAGESSAGLRDHEQLELSR